MKKTIKIGLVHIGEGYNGMTQKIEKQKAIYENLAIVNENYK